MKANPLALAIAQQTQGTPRYVEGPAEIKSLYDPRAEMVHVKEDPIDTRLVVEMVKVDGQMVRLVPALTIVDGMARRAFDTDGFTHVLSVNTDFANALMVAKLQSFCHGSHEYVYLEGEWAITAYHTNTNRRVRS